MKKIVFLLVFFPLFSFSQEKWTLEKCINYAIQNNLQVKTQSLNNQIDKNNFLQSKLNLLPNLNIGASEAFVIGRSVDPFTNEFSTENYNSTNFQISSSITLFNGLQNVNQIKKAKIDSQRSEVQIEITKKNITLNIVSAYLNILYSNDLVEIAERQGEITQQQLNRITILVENGKLPQQNKYEFEAQLANEELNIVTYKNQLENAKLILVQFLDLTDYKDFDIEIPNATIIENYTLLSFSQIYEDAQQNMPEIKAAELSVESSERSLAIARGGFYPRLTFSANYGTGYSSARQMIDNILAGSPVLTEAFVTDALGNQLHVYDSQSSFTYKKQPFDYQIKDNSSASFAFNLTIPIFNNYQVKTNVNNSKIYIEQSKLAIEQTKKDLQKEIQQAYSDAQAALKKHIATEKTLESNRLNFNYIEARYQQGLVNPTDYNVAKNNLSKVETEHLKAKYDFIFKTKILDFYSGKGIKF